MSDIFKMIKDSGQNYQDILQADGTFYACHRLYGKHPIFHTASDQGKTVPDSCGEATPAPVPFSIGVAIRTDGTKTHTSDQATQRLWQQYWYENIEAFRILTDSLPQSIVTAYVGRQSIETGFKYLLKKQHAVFKKSHDLGYLADILFQTYHLSDVSYMEYVNSFCHSYFNNIEGKNSEYFRYPEYKNDRTFAGTNLDIQWLSYNFALILLKLQHLDNENK